ncbi:FHA domain-containing protein [Gimesia aquarii]|uniref:FHA domain protein n=1 Tax=Gimesia aquarii TaxID=2527964 RepID=A0A517WVC1_9PLAN|nr:FHA domain-containing protein [Gimesia aquarii]QDU09182.1 FHA domain protein [Gimesia aquarii]
MKIRLNVQNPSKKSKPITLTKNTLIGRASDCDLKLNSDLVSRYHCKIFLTDSVALLHDLGSSNGTFIDGKKLTPKRDTKLSSGSLLSIADVSFRIEYDSQEFLEVGSTIHLNSLDELTSDNPLVSVSDDVVPIDSPAEISLPENHKHPDQKKPKDTVTIEEYSPDDQTDENKKTIQFPEIDLTDNMEED